MKSFGFVYLCQSIMKIYSGKKRNLIIVCENLTTLLTLLYVNHKYRKLLRYYYSSILTIAAINLFICIAIEK